MPESSTCKPALISSARFFQSEVIGELRPGWHGRSLSSKVVSTENGSVSWLKVRFFTIKHRNSLAATGEREAVLLDPVINKPRLKDQIEWQEGPHIWQADLLECIPEHACSSNPVLRESIGVSNEWLADVQQSLERIASIKTERISVRQDLITRRIEAYFGLNLETKVELWTTSHGDLHWGNLTQSKLYFLDWQSWGRGPLGLDAAFLLCFSGLVPEIAAAVRSQFQQQLGSRDGRISMLFACAELMRRIEVYGEHPNLLPWLQTLAFEARTGMHVLG